MDQHVFGAAELLLIIHVVVYRPIAQRLISLSLSTLQTRSNKFRPS